MWRPSEVVTENKKRATLLWVVLLLTIAGFVIWQIVLLVKQYENPSTTVTVSDENFRFPYTEVCFWDLNGCDESFGPAQCLAGVQHNVSDTCGDLWDVTVKSKFDCMAFDLEKVDIDGFEAKCDAQSEKPSISIWMFWITSIDAGGEEAFNSRVGVFLGGEDVQELTWVPYSRLVPSEGVDTSETTIPLTDMTIGKSVRKYLSGSSITSYPTLTISTTDHTSQNFFGDNSLPSSLGGGEDIAYGTLLLTLTLGRFSLTEVSDDNPINMLDFIGNIGGFWEILLLAWGVFFIATQHDPEPTEKARSFDKSLQRGKSLLRRQRRSPSEAVVTDVEGRDEENPDWDIAHGGPLQATDSGNGDRVSTNESTV